MNEKEILERAYLEAQKIVSENSFREFDTSLCENVDFLIDKIGSNKSIVSALATSLLKKITNPEQDIRLHRTDFENGYSARSLDTKVVTPFFKRHFPKYANKESAFLTLSTRERIKWNKNEGKNLKIRSKALKRSFLNVFEQIEDGNANPRVYLNYLFAKLQALSSKDELIFQLAKKQSGRSGVLNINLIIEMLQRHFAEKLSSRLPVVAIYSIYEILVPNLKRYDNKRLLPLQVHTSSDKHGFGDIEIYGDDGKPFEIIDIKHNISIDADLIFDIIKKTTTTSIDRYYILTTFPDGFETKEIEKAVNEFIIQTKTQKKIDIIANGIIPTLKYYLRFIDDYNLFIKKYTNNLVKDAKNSTEIKTFHIDKWIKILKEYKINNV
ncbi:MAG TPA: DNA methyltransferase [Chloroflexi bacterium]|nr:DNA methyltransferase [Chloroflexota bacterium]